MQIIYAVFAYLRKSEGFGKLTKYLSAFEAVLFELPRSIREIKKGKTISACLCYLQSGFPQF
jgi:hypothetical protein